MCRIDGGSVRSAGKKLRVGATTRRVSMLKTRIRSQSRRLARLGAMASPFTIAISGQSELLYAETRQIKAFAK